MGLVAWLALSVAHDLPFAIVVSVASCPYLLIACSVRLPFLNASNWHTGGSRLVSLLVMMFGGSSVIEHVDARITLALNHYAVRKDGVLGWWWLLRRSEYRHQMLAEYRKKYKRLYEAEFGDYEPQL
jgi:hypothetical protein